MFQCVFILINCYVLFHVIVCHYILNELFVLFVLFVLFLLLRFLLCWLCFISHHTLIFKVFEFDQFGEFFVLHSTYENDFLESFKVLQLLSMRQEPQIKPFDNSATLQITQHTFNFDIFPLIFSRNIIIVHFRY